MQIVNATASEQGNAVMVDPPIDYAGTNQAFHLPIGQPEGALGSLLLRDASFAQTSVEMSLGLFQRQRYVRHLVAPMRGDGQARIESHQFRLRRRRFFVIPLLG